MVEVVAMVAFLLWCILFLLCWPLALAALVLYPIVWLIALPFRLVGITVHGVLDLCARFSIFRRDCCAAREPSSAAIALGLTFR